MHQLQRVEEENVETQRGGNDDKRKDGVEAEIR